MADLRALCGFTPRRISLLDQIETFTNLVTKVIPVCALWVSGSLLTDKPEPGDADLLVVFSEDDISTLGGVAAKRLVTTVGLKELVARRGLDLDAFAMIWRARPGAAVAREDEQYLMYRGYWDDFWMRMRTVPKSEPPTRACAMPRRGYVEVIIDGYR